MKEFSRLQVNKCSDFDCPSHIYITAQTKIIAYKFIMLNAVSLHSNITSKTRRQNASDMNENTQALLRLKRSER